MAIKVHLDRILLERRMSLTELADRVGVTIANLSILKTGKARAIRFSTLDALCRELDCQPGDLVAYEPGPGSEDDDDEHRYQLPGQFGLIIEPRAIVPYSKPQDHQRAE